MLATLGTIILGCITAIILTVTLVFLYAAGKALIDINKNKAKEPGESKVIPLDKGRN
jgi:hypothetical protein